MSKLTDIMHIAGQTTDSASECKTHMGFQDKVTNFPNGFVVTYKARQTSILNLI